MSEQKLRIENKAAHVKHIALGSGQTLAIPPSEEGAPGTGFTLTTDQEIAAFEASLTQPVVKEWIDSGELVVHRSGGAPAPAAQPPQSGKGATASDTKATQKSQG